MLLKKTRAVPFSQEKIKRDPNKPYYTPSNYSRVKKSDKNRSSFVLPEDFV